MHKQVVIGYQKHQIILVLQVTKIGLFRHIINHGYTIEAGIGENPLPISQFDEIYNDNIGILILGALV